MAFLPDMMSGFKQPGAFKAAMGEMAPLMFSMAHGLRTGQGAMAYAPQGLAAMMEMQEKEDERDEKRKKEAAEREAMARAQGAITDVLGAYSGGTSGAPSKYDAMEAYGGPTNAAANAMNIVPMIEQTAQSIGMDPVDLATIMSYETGGTFDPTKAGPTTQWGQHRGLIQFGEPQAQQYGVNWEDPVGSQLGPDGAVARYFKENGWKPGMSFADAYSIVNAGAPGRYNASDANNGGAPGTVLDKVQTQMAGHRKRAEAMFGSRQQQQPRFSPERASQIISNPNVPAAVKEMVLREFVPKTNEPTAMVQNIQALESMGYSRNQAVQIATGRTGEVDPPERDMREDVNGVLRYVDTREPVFPDVQPAPSEDQSAKEERIQRLMETGIDRNTAIGIADGRLAVSRDPLTGEVVIVDVATAPRAGAAPQPPAPGQPPAQQPPQQPFTFGNQFENADRAGGLGGFLRGGANTIADTLGQDLPYPETEAAQTDFANFGEGIVNAFASAYGRQPPSWLLQNIANLAPRPGITEGSGTMQEKLRGMGRELQTRRQALSAELGRDMDPKARSDVQGQILGIDAALRQINQALEGFGATTQPTQGTRRLRFNPETGTLEPVQ